MTVPRASAGAAIAAALSCCTRSRCCAWFHSDQPRLSLPRLSSRARSACIVSADGCNPPAAPLADRHGPSGGMHAACTRRGPRTQPRSPAALCWARAPAGAQGRPRARAQRPQAAPLLPAAQTALWPLFGRGGLNRPSSPPFGPCALGPFRDPRAPVLAPGAARTRARCRLPAATRLGLDAHSCPTHARARGGTRPHPVGARAAPTPPLRSAAGWAAAQEWP